MTKTTLSPQLGALVTKMTNMPDLDAALAKILLEYLALKLHELEEEVHRFERKWGMSFEEFGRRIETGTLDRDVYDYEVESDFWDWEAAVTLLDHYRSLREQWM